MQTHQPFSPRWNRPLVRWIASCAVIPVFATLMIAGESRRKASTDTVKVVLIFPEMDRLPAAQRAALEPLCAKDAWNRFYADRNAPSRDESGRLVSRATTQDLEQQAADLGSRSKSSASPARIGAAESLSTALAEQIALQLKEQVDRRRLNGKRLALVVGRSAFTSAHIDSRADARLENMLGRLAEVLASRPDVREHFTVIARAELSAPDLISGIGNGSDAWLKPKKFFGSTGRPVVLGGADYEPKEVFVLTGELVERLDDLCHMHYTLSARLFYPQSQRDTSIAASDVETSYWLHPTRNWISAAEDEGLARSMR